MSATAVEPEVGEGQPDNLPVLSQARPSGLLRPVAKPAEVIAAQEETRTLIEQALKPGRDYGLVPGTDKPSLLKPGAERVCLAFGTYPRFKILEQEVDHDREVPWVKRKKIFEGRGNNRQFKGWQEERGTSIGLYRYVFLCEIVHRETDIVVGECIGSCSSLESKYVDRPRDSENTVVKMGQKRAHVGATLLTFGLSDQFTQDVEDNPDAVQGNGAEDTGREPAPPCPKCGGPMFDNRDKNLERVAEGKSRIPDFKCRQAKGPCGEQKGDRFNETVIWHLDEKAGKAEGDSTSSATKKEAPSSDSTSPAGPTNTMARGRQMTGEEYRALMTEADLAGIHTGEAWKAFVETVLKRPLRNEDEIRWPDDVALLTAELKQLAPHKGGKK